VRRYQPWNGHGEAVTMPFATECAKCLRPLQRGEAIRLWDGKDYCRPCLDRASPSLAEYARRNATLNDGFAFTGGTARFWLRFGLVAALAILGPFAAATALAIMLRPWEDNDPVGWVIIGLLVLLGILGLSALLVGVLRALRQGWAVEVMVLSLLRPRVRIQDGLVYLKRGPSCCPRGTNYPLAKCRWFPLDLHLLKLPIHHWHDRREFRALRQLDPEWRGVVILLPPEHPMRGLIAGHGVPSGTSRTAAVWEAFLTLADVPHGDLLA
jgi:hypothetical protein